MTAPEKNHDERLRPLKMPLPMEDALRGAMQVPPPKDKAAPKAENESDQDASAEEGEEPASPEKP